ncbi:MAG: ribosome biogenesis GTPase Der [Candidatus Howiella sp.]|jgi:GTP-binding protein
MAKSRAVVAVVGRPNVGKSTLFNKLIGKRLSIVDDTPGVTRDRIYGDCEWLGRTVLLVDTGGIEPRADDLILSKMRMQAQLAIDTAAVILCVTDIRSGVTAADMEIAAMLRKSGKPVVLCVNKCDTLGAPPVELYEFYNLGLGEPIQVSAEHGHGTGDLLDEVFAHLPEEPEEESEEEVIRVALIGKPNVGKSSLVNRISGEERSIVSDIAGTTRDAIDTPVENVHGKFIFIDTAGLRRKSKVEDSIEKYSVLRAKMAVERADVCVILIDATEGFTEQDSKVAGIALEQGKACIIAVNKWDAVEKDGSTMAVFRKKLETDFSFMSYAPIVFISAKTGQRVDRLYELIHYVYDQNCMRISTGMLNDLLADATARVQPPSDKGKRLKIFYMTQASVKPPTFVCFCNREELFHFSYQRYLENQIRSTFGLEGTPVRFIIRERGDGKTKA